jgi:hypothetical protein
MSDWLTFAVLLALCVGLMRWVLPKLGVPT